MKPSSTRALQLAIRQKTQCTLAKSTISSSTFACQRHQIHSTPATPATVSPIHGTGPPPEPPEPAADSASARHERRRKHSELLEKARAMREDQKLKIAKFTSDKKAARDIMLKKRFWKHAQVHDVDGALEVHLDTRPLRHPTSKEIIRLPRSKPLLATAVAVEWDMLVSAQQATRQHLIPLTSLVCRALDIAEDDGGGSAGKGESVRESITRMVMNYLDTDSLLCWAPPPREYDPLPDGVESLRDAQRRAAEGVVGFLTARVWPGVPQIEPVLDGETLTPKSHPEVTRQIIQGWVAGLGPWELAGLERGVLAGKGLLGAARLIVEWSEGFVGTGPAEERFGVEEAARLASIEVDWQTGRWGEVEDTHDVEKEDLRRQLGSVVLLVSGTGSK